MQKRITLQPSFDYKVLFKSLFSNISHKKFIISNSARSSFDLCLETAKAGDNRQPNKSKKAQHLKTLNILFPR